jgi:hypothetical protein
MYRRISCAPVRSSSNRIWIVAAVLVVAVAAAVILLGGGGDDDSGGEKLETLEAGGPSDTAPAASKFKLSYPPSWEEIPEDEITAKGPGETLAILRRQNRSGLVSVTRQKSSPNLDLNKLGTRLGKQVKAGLPDAREVASRPTRLPAGDAFVYSFVRRRAGTVHTIVVVPSGAETYVLNAVVPSGDNRAAQESGEIVRSLTFD